MNAAIIAVGSELLRSGRRDTNGEWLAERLQRRGVEVTGRTIVDDDVTRLSEVLVRSAAAVDLVLVTGGLGPTEDDRTRDALASACGLPLERDPRVVERLERLFEERGFGFHSNQARQADKPAGARWIENDLGTAPGICCRIGQTQVVALPGVPPEMRRMFEREMVTWNTETGASRLARRSLKIAGRLESSVDRRIRDLYDVEEVDITILAGADGIELQLMARGTSREAALNAVAGVERELYRRFPDDLYGVDDETLAGIVGAQLKDAGLTVATAESCTAGLLAAAITAVPGASVWFRGGLVVYHDDLKRDLAGVPAALIESHGAVSEPVARSLAEDVRTRCAADLGVGITGIAGPAGGSPAKPVGTVHVAVSDGKQTEHRSARMTGDRDLVRRRAAVFALDRVRRLLHRRRNRADSVRG